MTEKYKVDEMNLYDELSDFEKASVPVPWQIVAQLVDDIKELRAKLAEVEKERDELESRENAPRIQELDAINNYETLLSDYHIEVARAEKAEAANDAIWERCLKAARESSVDSTGLFLTAAEAIRAEREKWRSNYER